MTQIRSTSWTSLLLRLTLARLSPFLWTMEPSALVIVPGRLRTLPTTKRLKLVPLVVLVLYLTTPGLPLTLLLLRPQKATLFGPIYVSLRPLTQQIPSAHPRTVGILDVTQDLLPLIFRTTGSLPSVIKTLLGQLWNTTVSVQELWTCITVRCIVLIGDLLHPRQQQLISPIVILALAEEQKEHFSWRSPLPSLRQPLTTLPRIVVIPLPLSIRGRVPILDGLLRAV